MKKSKNRFEGVVILKEERRDYDSKGRRVYLEREVEEKEDVAEEPYDPAYLEDAEPVKPRAERGERAYFSKLKRLQKLIRKYGIPYEWDENEMYEITLPSDTEYDHVRYLYVDENWFCFSTYEDIVYYTEDLKEFEAYLVEWLDSINPEEDGND